MITCSLRVVLQLCEQSLWKTASRFSWNHIYSITLSMVGFSLIGLSTQIAKEKKWSDAEDRTKHIPHCISHIEVIQSFKFRNIFFFVFYLSRLFFLLSCRCFAKKNRWSLTSYLWKKKLFFDLQTFEHTWENWESSRGEIWKNAFQSIKFFLIFIRSQRNKKLNFFHSLRSQLFTKTKTDFVKQWYVCYCHTEYVIYLEAVGTGFHWTV